MNLRRLLLLFAVSPTLLAMAADEAPKPAEPGTLVVVDASGKEQKLKAWKFIEGVRRLGWLAKPAAPDKEKKDAPKDKREAPADKGPEALVLRTETTIKYAEGVLTLIPLSQLHSLDFDNEMDTATARAAAGADNIETLTGTTKYKRINKLTIEAEVDKGDLGVAEIKYLGGYPRGICGVRFPAPKSVPPAPEGRRVLVVSDDGEKKTTHKVVDLMPLYRLPDGGEKLLPTLMFKKTLKVDVGKIKKVAAMSENVWQVTLKDGGDETLTLLETIPHEGKQARLLGLVGRVPVGYKLFPAAGIAEITFDADAEEK
ncbi:MAG TPA: hypothetical protein VH643_15940 [Gemmataceae bacterium]|jgi:hypothetical protein